MPLFIALLITSALGFSLYLFSFTAKLSPIFHNLCLHFLDLPSAHPLRSLLCGEPVRDQELKITLRNAGLLHLFVVSGAHLIWLEHALVRIRLPFFFRVGLWTLFSFACGWQPPVVRSLCGLFLGRLQERWAPRWRADQQVLFAGLLTLTIFPPWGHSLSLALSWTAALALSFPLGKGWKGDLGHCALVWVFLLPLLATWSSVSPLTILVNCFLAPLFSLCLFPLGVLAVCFSFLLPLFDFLFHAFIELLKALPPAPPPDSSRVPNPSMMWAWILFLQLSMHFHLTRKGRARS